MTRQETSEAIFAMLAGKPDFLMRKHGFSRAVRSIQYKRRIGEVDQIVEMSWRRSVHRDEVAVAHIAPRALMASKMIVPAANALSDNGRLLAKRPDIIMNEAIGHLGPEANLVVWRPKDVSEFTRLGEEISEYLEQWVIPFVNQYVSLKAFTSGYEHGDTRLPHGDQWAIRIAAAYMTLNEVEKARALIRSRFWEKPGLRERYLTALSYLGVVD